MQEKQNTEIMNMVPSDLIRWCKERKKSLGLSNHKLAELSGVPVGTIDRILSGSYMEFRYSSIQPLVAILVGINDSTPEPEKKNDEQGQYYYETIEGYRLIVDEKNKQIEQLRFINSQKDKEVSFLRDEIQSMQNNLKAVQDNCIWLQKIIDEMRNNTN